MMSEPDLTRHAFDCRCPELQAEVDELTRQLSGAQEQLATATPDLKGCAFCGGLKGGEKGNENIIGDVVVCDYCSVLLNQQLATARADALEDLRIWCSRYRIEPRDERNVGCQYLGVVITEIDRRLSASPPQPVEPEKCPACHEGIYTSPQHDPERCGWDGLGTCPVCGGEAGRVLGSTPCPDCTKEPPIADRYSELIMGVGMKHPGETRHQTALRYILQAEESDNTPCVEAQPPGSPNDD